LHPVLHAFCCKIGWRRASSVALDPEMRLSNLNDRIGKFGRADDLEKYEGALRLAGLSE
jgi:hypothetical protein